MSKVRTCESYAAFYTISTILVKSLCTVDLATPGDYLVFRNARTDMFRGSMRLAVNQWGKVEAAEPNQDFQVKVILPLFGMKLIVLHMCVMFMPLAHRWKITCP